MTAAPTSLPNSSAATPLRVGIGPAGVPSVRRRGSGPTAVDLARRVEALGYSSLAVADHVESRNAPLPLLAAAAGATSRLTLATHVLCTEFRPAALLAQEVRTVAQLADGRLELGLGTGWLQRDFELTGIPMAPFPVRLRRLQETIAILREDLADLMPPLLIGGGGPRILTTAAQLADIVSVNVPLGGATGVARAGLAGGTREAFDSRVDLVREAAATAQRTIALHVVVHHVHLGPSWREDAGAGAAAAGLTLGEYLESPHVLAGDVPRMADLVLQRRARYGFDYLTVTGAVAEEFVPVLDRLRAA